MNRTLVSLIAGTAALAAVTGLAALELPGTAAPATTEAAAELPVERTSLICPAPSGSELADTVYTSFTPVTKGAGGRGTARLTPATEAGTAAGGHKAGGDKKTSKPVLTAKAPGTPATGTTSGGDDPALVGVAEGGYASGWTLQQTTEVSAGTGRGLLGVNCTAPDTDFWFPGASTAADRTDYVHLTNPDDSAAVVDIELYDQEGTLAATAGENLTVKPHSSDPILLSTLTDKKLDELTVHVNVRSGRVAAAVQALDDKLGGDWLAATAEPAGSLVIPGIPKDAVSVRLVAFAPGGSDADLKVQLASVSGLINPAGHETLHVKAGMTAAADLGDITRGEAGSLVLTPTDRSVPVVAAVRVVRGKGDAQESAFIPATAAVGTRASAVGNSAKGTTLSLTAPTGTARVKVTASAGSEGGTPVSKTYTIKSGTTQDITPPAPAGLKGTYALTVEHLSGAPVYASRTLRSTDTDTAAFTVQTLPDDHGTVTVPDAREDLTVLLK
ncbi:DUF5719 family protein [Streptomyces sp. bgisy153]|uniref:DUF5719 family protein n=1 Tax=Streptomyces sp. bgisy153 TaxID=3413793 RepID=UPI003D721A65